VFTEHLFEPINLVQTALEYASRPIKMIEYFGGASFIENFRVVSEIAIRGE
jgi:hypothetical protein